MKALSICVVFLFGLTVLVLAGCQKPAEPGPSPLPSASPGPSKTKAPVPEKPAESATKKEVANLKNADGKYLCPVCDMVIDDPATAPSVEEGGKTVYLCSQADVDKFKADPAKYMPEDDEPSEVDETKIGNAKNLEGKYICPVRLEPIADLASAPKVEHGGKTYYFCCPGCDDEFKKDPEKYIATIAPRSPEGAGKTS